MSTPELAPRATYGGVIAVWVIAALAGVAIGIFAPVGQRAGWVSIALAGCLLLSFAVQLGYARPRRFIARMAASIVGAFIVLGIISGAFGLAALSTH